MIGWSSTTVIDGCRSSLLVRFSAHFVSAISSETILDNEIMVSFDVESLFTNVPIVAAVQAALQKLENDPSLPDRTTLTPTQIAELLNFVLRSTYFQYNGSIYEQQKEKKNVLNMCKYSERAAFSLFKKIQDKLFSLS